MIHYDQPLYRPPSEADSLIIQVTLGCSHNRCIFCDMYKGKDFLIRPLEAVLEDLDTAIPYAGRISKVFLADGDALGIPTDYLLAILENVNRRFPLVRRISAYANTGNLLKKSGRELELLREAGLGLLYLGAESGSDNLLRRIRKGALKDHHREAILRARAAGMQISVMIITGLGGEEFSREHQEQSADLINQAPPTYLATLSLMISDQARPLFTEAFPEGFTELDDFQGLEENRGLLSLIETETPVIFRSNHASNALSLKGTLPADRDRLIAQIDGALEGHTSVRPLWMRGL